MLRFSYYIRNWDSGTLSVFFTVFHNQIWLAISFIHTFKIIPVSIPNLFCA